MPWIETNNNDKTEQLRKKATSIFSILWEKNTSNFKVQYLKLDIKLIYCPPDIRNSCPIWGRTCPTQFGDFCSLCSIAKSLSNIYIIAVTLGIFLTPCFSQRRWRTSFDRQYSCFTIPKREITLKSFCLVGNLAIWDLVFNDGGRRDAVLKY